MKITITGHRPPRLKENQEVIESWLKKKFEEYRPELVILGMAQGVDQIAAWTCKEYGWNFKAIYAFKRELHPVEKHLTECDYCKEVVFLKEEYSKRSDYIERDRVMVDEGDVVLAVWDGVPIGGTWETIKYAREQGKKVEIYGDGD